MYYENNENKIYREWFVEVKKNLIYINDKD